MTATSSDKLVRGLLARQRTALAAVRAALSREDAAFDEQMASVEAYAIATAAMIVAAHSAERTPKKRQAEVAE